MILVPILALHLPKTDEFLLTRRLKGKEFAGCLEFPGGKCEAHETATQALKREIKEELDIDIAQEDLKEIAFRQTAHNHKTYLLLLYYCNIYKGRAIPKEGQEIVTIHQDHLHDCAMPPANQDLIHSLLLFLKRK